MILVLVLRYSITKLRELGLAFILPLDNNIYIHKVVGWIIFGQSLFHTIMHLCNFGKLNNFRPLSYLGVFSNDFFCMQNERIYIIIIVFQQ